MLMVVIAIARGVGPRESGVDLGAFNGSYIRVAGEGPGGGDPRDRGATPQGGFPRGWVGPSFLLCSLVGDTFLVGCSMYVVEVGGGGGGEEVLSLGPGLGLLDSRGAPDSHSLACGHV